MKEKISPRSPGVKTSKMDFNKGLEKASQLLQRKIPHGSQLLKPKKTWLQTVPEKDCDVVMVMSPTAQESTVHWLVTEIKSNLPQLTVSTKNIASVKSYGIYLHATFEGLLRGAEEMRLVKRTKPDHGGDLREFSRNEISIFQDADDEKAFFTTEERQGIVLHFLNTLRAYQKESIEKASIRQGQAIVPKLLSKGIIRSLMPLHEADKLKPLKRRWIRKIFEQQPLDDIQEYFGSRIAFYFAWLGHYTIALMIPAVIGVIFWSLEDKGFVVFAFLNVLWASVWLETWKRRSKELAYRWGTLDSHLEAFTEPRPRFKGDLAVSRVTGHLEPYYPSWRRNLTRYLITLPLIIASLFVVFFVMLFVIRFQDACGSFLSSLNLTFLSFAPKTLMAIPISLFDKWYTRLARWLNDKENYRSEEAYQNNLIMKLLLFRFVNSFLSLFYIAFYLQDLPRLKEQLAALLFMKQLTGNVKESIVPYLKKRIQQSKISFELSGSTKISKEVKTEDICHEYYDEDSDNGHYELDKVDGAEDQQDTSRQISQVEVESKMTKYDGTFKDSLEIFVQFGYVTLFSPAFPLAAAFAIVSNVIEIRTDAFKMCHVFQRPFGERAQGIGVWQDAMELMGVLSIIVNCALIGMSGQIQQVYPGISIAQVIILMVILEHLLIALKYGISYAIPDIPEWVETQIAKNEFHRREILKNLKREQSK